MHMEAYLFSFPLNVLHTHTHNCLRLYFEGQLKLPRASQRHILKGIFAKKIACAVLEIPVFDVLRQIYGARSIIKLNFRYTFMKISSQTANVVNIGQISNKQYML